MTRLRAPVWRERWNFRSSDSRWANTRLATLRMADWDTCKGMCDWEQVWVWTCVCVCGCVCVCVSFCVCDTMFVG
jgi:hypothetical protein